MTLGRRTGSFSAPMASQSSSPGETLAQRYFIESSVFDEETEKIFRARWLFVERTSALEKAAGILYRLTSRAKG